MKSQRFLLLAFLLLLHLTFLPQTEAQNSGETIREISFEGIRRIAKGELLNRIVSRVGQKFDSDKLIQDLERLYRLGHFDSPDKSSPPIKVRVDKVPGGGVKIVFSVTERPVIVQVKVTGAKAFKTSEIQEGVRSEVGQVFDTYLVDRDVQRLKETLLDKGYLFADVSYETKKNKAGDIILDYKTSAGPQVTIDELEYIGVKFFDDADI
ncbi:MAG: POTRA domain-containing protein, partial [Planctomycetota bacterium]|nr:POTRA domain-containing protein [Planctomycetota bacterium]